MEAIAAAAVRRVARAEGPARGRGGGAQGRGGGGEAEEAAAEKAIVEEAAAKETAEELEAAAEEAAVEEAAAVDEGGAVFAARARGGARGAAAAEAAAAEARAAAAEAEARELQAQLREARAERDAAMREADGCARGRRPSCARRTRRGERRTATLRPLSPPHRLAPATRAAAGWCGRGGHDSRRPGRPLDEPELMLEHAPSAASDVSADPTLSPRKIAQQHALASPLR